jgi:hypothetical protein
MQSSRGLHLALALSTWCGQHHSGAAVPACAWVIVGKLLDAAEAPVARWVLIEYALMCKFVINPLMCADHLC